MNLDKLTTTFTTNPIIDLQGNRINVGDTVVVPYRTYRETTLKIDIVHKLYPEKKKIRTVKAGLYYGSNCLVINNMLSDDIVKKNEHDADQFNQQLIDQKKQKTFTRFTDMLWIDKKNGTKGFVWVKATTNPGQYILGVKNISESINKLTSKFPDIEFYYRDKYNQYHMLTKSTKYKDIKFAAYFENCTIFYRQWDAIPASFDYIFSTIINEDHDLTKKYLLRRIDQYSTKGTNWYRPSYDFKFDPDYSITTEYSQNHKTFKYDKNITDIEVDTIRNARIMMILDREKNDFTDYWLDKWTSNNVYYDYNNIIFPVINRESNMKVVEEIAEILNICH